METKVTQKDLIGALKNFPIEVVEKMLQKQYKQMNKMDISVFQENKCSDIQHGGFVGKILLKDMNFGVK